MAVIEPTVDKLNEPTVMLQIRNVAKAVDNNLNAVNDEMAGIHNQINQMEDTSARVDALEDDMETAQQAITEIQQKDMEQDTAISQNESAIETEVTARQNADITGASLSIVSGAIQLMLNRALGAINANVTAPFIKTMELIPTTTERAFKVRITYWDNTQYDTNDFVIPAGGGTDVSVTGVTIQDGTTPNSFQVQIELSDGTPISSNDYPFPTQSVNPYPTSATLALSGNTLSLAIGLSNSETVYGSVDLAPLLNGYATQVWVNGQLAGYVTDAELTQVQSDLQEQISGLKLSTNNNNITLNEDSVQIVKEVTGSVSGNNLTIGVNGVNSPIITLPSGGENWEKLDLNNLPTDFAEGDILLLFTRFTPTLTSYPANWTDSNIGDIEVVTNNGYNSPLLIKLKSDQNYSYIDIAQNSFGVTCINTITVNRVSPYSNWNIDQDCLDIEIMSFNGATAKTKYFQVLRSTIGTYFIEGYRLRSTQ